MAFNKVNYLNEKQLLYILSIFNHDETLSVTKLHYENKQTIKRAENITVDELRAFIFEAIESGWAVDLELYIPALSKILVGQNDGVYWLE